MARDNGIVTLGAEWWMYSREFWGSRDRAKAAASQSQELGSTVVGPTLPAIAPGWFRPRPRRGTDSAASRAVDELLEAQGIRPRR
jgi:hypothetical protein